jgi:hypothetical protein
MKYFAKKGDCSFMATEITVSLYAQRRLSIGKAHELADGFASVLLGGLVQRVFFGHKRECGELYVSVSQTMTTSPSQYLFFQLLR